MIRVAMQPAHAFLLWLAVGLIGMASMPAQDIPTRTLVEVGTGPALLIGVGDYDGSGSVFDPLPGIGKDLDAIEATIRKLGWTDVTVLRDPSQGELRAAVDRFGPKAQAASGASFFYYSGHGVLQDRLNYMIPARAQVRTRKHLPVYALPVEDVLAYLGDEGSGPALVFIDACRNNDLPADGKSGGSDLLLSRRAGLFIGFATAEGEISNASTAGSIYTRSLAQRLLTPGRSLDDIYAGIIADVERNTSGLARAIQPPEKQSALRFVLQMLPGGEADEVARLRAELDKVRREKDGMAALALVVPKVPAPAPLPSPPTLPAPQPSTNTPQPFTNTLGMKFVPVPGTKVLFSIWETRVQDYAAYAVAVSGVDGTWKDYEYEGHKQGPDHPVVNVSWEDAQAFCKWLSKKEGKTYRLPTDHEWSVAVGIGDRESADVSPSDKDGRIEGYPWGNQWPPPKESGNFGSIYRRTDPHVFTAPVGSYQVTRLGLYDLSGNAREWCDAFYQSGKEWRVLRGGCWVDCDPTVAEMEEDRRRVLDGGRMKFSALAKLRSSYRFYDAPASRKGDSGFRCVLEVGSGG
jgi:hypothetical protein